MRQEGTAEHRGWPWLSGLRVSADTVGGDVTMLRAKFPQSPRFSATNAKLPWEGTDLAGSTQIIQRSNPNGREVQICTPGSFLS